ncbi:M16 family metallopeptidase [Terriglobus roseus]|uniref:Predicted Zn-dependent peptidase n=1 Tax=Terriglobus roseus TaxID=392734 RepID=A0A1G7JQ49_9BACT|nr:pitrilysin family protein [Terriglobus roseus]SDF26924.1 Predicted Zn-dependent peptidase [Terriglobus roseus]
MVETTPLAENAASATASNERNIRRTTLPNGMMVLTERMPHVRSVSLGVWIGTGSRDEQAEENGLSHFVEHMVFKGTTTRSARDIARETDAIGGNLDAFTGKETVCFNIKVLDTNVPAAMNILSDLVLNPTFAADDIAREQSVVLEEIKMDEDNPDYLIHEIHTANFWKNDPLARSILGTAKTVSSFDEAAVRRFHSERFVPSNMVFSAAGHLEHEEMIAEITRYFGALAATSSTLARFPEPAPTPHITLRNKKSLEQVQICLGVPAPRVDHPDRYALYLLSSILGGGMSSRLFQSVREEAGLAYSIYSELSPFRDTGALSIYAGTSIEKTQEMLHLILEEFRRIKAAPVGEDELERAKNQSKGNIVLGLESSSSRMSNLARQQMYYGRFNTVDDIIADVDRVTAADVQRLAVSLLQPEKISLTLLGNLGELKITRDDLTC